MPKNREDFVVKEKKNSKNAAQYFLTFRVDLGQRQTYNYIEN